MGKPEPQAVRISKADSALEATPSPLGRGWPAAGGFISRSGTGEGSVGLDGPHPAFGTPLPLGGERGRRWERPHCPHAVG